MLLKKIVLGTCLVFCLGYFCSPIFADTLVLKSGQVIEGKIIENTAKFVKIDFDGVELVYFQEEIVSINQDQANNTASQELTSLYEAFKSSKKVIENKNPPAAPIELIQPTVNPGVQNIMNANSIPLSNTSGDLNSTAAAQAGISQLPKEYQDIIKSSLQNMQSSGNTGQSPGTTPVDLSSLPPEYQDMIKSNLKQLQPDSPATKKEFSDGLEKQY